MWYPGYIPRVVHRKLTRIGVYFNLPPRDNAPRAAGRERTIRAAKCENDPHEKAAPQKSRFFALKVNMYYKLHINKVQSTWYPGPIT